MYLPKCYESENLDESFALIQKNPLATLISTTEQGPFISHIPLVLEKKSEDFSLIGHLARGNPHWKLLDNKPVYIIFHGPNSYITPNWYENNDAPTWAYAVVHINGTASLIQDLDGIMSCLKKLSDVAESNSKDPWEFWIPDDLAAPGVIEKSIVGFEIKISDIKSKFKLNQTRSEADLIGCLQGLRSHPKNSNEELTKMMMQSWESFHNRPPQIPMNQIHLRNALISEAEQLSTICMRSKSYWPYPADYLTQSTALLKISEADISNWPVVVAENKSEIVGFFALKTINNENRLDHLWIDPRFIGQGFGQILFKESLTQAAKLGWKSFRIVSEPYSELFYIKMGAKKIGQVQSRVKPDFFLPHLEIDF